MAYQEVTRTGYGTRVGNSFKAIGIGILMFVLGTALLWWNEGRAVKTEKMLDEAGSAYVEMENPNKKDASLEGELICGTAMATTEDSLIDADFGIGAKAISIRRSVEYYQWVEHTKTEKKDKLGGAEETVTTYTYSKQWVSSPIQSSQFHDPAYQNKNTVLTTYEDAQQYAENVSFGAYKLNESLIHSISSREAMELAIADDMLKQFDKSTQAAYERFYGVQKSVQQQPTTQQPVQTPAIPDSVRALLSDSAKAVLDSLQAVNDSINKSMEAANNKQDTLTQHTAAFPSQRMDEGHAQGNTLSGDTDGQPSARLAGRNVVGSLLLPSYGVQKSGRVVVKIMVDREGNVTEAIPGMEGTSVTDRSLWSAAKEAALQAHFNANPKAPISQEGTITYIFKLQ